MPGGKLSHKALHGRRVTTRQDVERGIASVQTHDSTAMFTDYADSVRFHADAEGKLPADVIHQLFQEHCCLPLEHPASSFAHYSSTVSDEQWDDADRVLSWLGY